MNFSTAQRVLTTIRAGDTAEYERGKNRCNINNAANCVPPLDPELAKKMGIKVNVNWGELMMLLAQARRAYRNASYLSQHFFKIRLPYAPPQYQSDWGYFLTDEINQKMKLSPKYFGVQESLFSAIVCHGVGPRLWYDRYKWCPDYIAVEDLRIPTDTTCDLENLEDGWFAVRHVYTPGELLDEAFKQGSRWDKEIVRQILKAKKDLNWDYPQDHYDWDTQPEKFAELVHQDGGYYAADAMPGFPMWHFYFADRTDKSNAGWWMKIVPAEGTIGATGDKFLWQSDRPIASKREQILQLQFGDLSNKSPFTVHGVRSLGFALLEPTFYTNITRCRLLQHVHDNFNIWLRSNDPADRARAQMQEFANFGVLKPGLAIVPQNERHQIQGDLVEMAMAQLKQLQQEASANYTQSTDTGTRREQTAFETSVKMEQVNAMLGGLLLKYFIYERFAHLEICRRFTLRDSDDEDVQDVQRKAKQYGIPDQFMDVKQWNVEEVTPLGMGNPTLARAAAKELMEILPMLDPTAQQEAKHEIVLVITGDPRKAARWVPLDKIRGITDAARDAMSMFGTLMQGVPVPVREGLPVIDQVEAMLPLLAGKITVITKRDNMATTDETIGLETVLGYIKDAVGQIAQDPKEKQRVKGYTDDLAKLENEVKGLAQRGAQARQKQQQGNGHDPAAMAKVQAAMMQAEVKAKATEEKAKQQQRHKEQAFVREQRRSDASTFAEIQRQDELAKTKRKALKSAKE